MNFYLTSLFVAIPLFMILIIIEELYAIAENFSGSCGLILHIMNNKNKFQKIKSGAILVSSSQECITAFREKLGYHNVWLSQ